MDTVDTFLEHFGVKGMRWGVRKDSSGRRGSGPKEYSQDSANAIAVKGKAQTKGVQSLSNKEIQDFANRLQLEARYTQLTKEPSFSDKVLGGKKRADEILGVGKTVNKAIEFKNSAAGQALGSKLAKDTAKKKAAKVAFKQAAKALG